MRGTIRKLIRDKGYGFIASDDGEDIFFHLSALAESQFDSLEEGQVVEYELEGDQSKLRSGQGPRAAKVTLVSS